MQALVEMIGLGLVLVGVIAFAVIQYRGRDDDHHGPGAAGSEFEKARAEALAQEHRHWGSF